MKKTLSNIFDEANANELEKLVSQNAASDVSADTLSSIKNKVYAKTGITKAKTKKPIAFRWQFYVAVAACLLLIVGGIFGAPSIMELFNGSKPFDDNGRYDMIFPIPDLDRIIWADNTLSGENPDAVETFVMWNGWTISSSLHEALNRASDTDVIAILVKKNDIDIDSFIYNGNTLGKLFDEYNEFGVLEGKLLGFHKEGELLKYGELLYTTGTPDGEIWSKKYYDNVVSFYGEDFIAKYIVNGEVQTDLLISDREICLKKCNELYEKITDLRKAYHENYVVDVQAVFGEAGALTDNRKYSVFLFVQKDKLAKLKVDGKENYVLNLANRTAYDPEYNSNANTPDNSVDNTVTGFMINKLYFNGVSTEVKTDADVATAIQTLVTDNDLLQFVIYSDIHLTKEDLEDMHYASFDQWNYPTRTVVSVRRENINMEAIKELTNRSDVTSVHIGALLVPLPDDVVDEPAVDG